MNFLKRAWISVTRRKGKSLLLFVIFSVIVNLVLAGFSIQSASWTAGELARQKLVATVTLLFDPDYLRDQALLGGGLQRLEPSLTMVPRETADLLLALDHVAAANYIRSATVHSSNFLHYGYQEEDDDAATEAPQSSGDVNVIGGLEGFEGFSFTGDARTGGVQLGIQLSNVWTLVGNIRVEGVTELSLVQEFMDGRSRIIEGRPITADDAGTDAVVIEKRLAEFNGLAVGDVIEVRMRDDETVHPLTIVGIYETDDVLDVTSSLPHTNPYNRIYTAYTFPARLTAADPESDDVLLDRAVFYLTDPIHLDAFLAQAEATGVDWDRYLLVTNDAQYQRMIGPIENIAELSGASVLVVGVAGALILGLVMMLSIRERTYEIGVLVSLGETRLKLCGQLVAEVLIVGIVAIGLSAFTGQVIAQAIGDELLQRELAVMQDLEAQGTFLPASPTVISRSAGGTVMPATPVTPATPLAAGGRLASAQVDPVDSIDVSVSAGEMLRLALASIIIAVGATILPAGYVLRFHPRSILTRTY